MSYNENNLERAIQAGLDVDNTCFNAMLKSVRLPRMHEMAIVNSFMHLEGMEYNTVEVLKEAWTDLQNGGYKFTK